MASYIKVHLNYNGAFIRRPLSYDEGNVHLFEDVDFAGMDAKECVEFIERFTQRKCEKMYFLLPGKSMAEGLKPMTSDLEYIDFIEVAYLSGCHVSMYIDHIGVNPLEWIFEDLEEVLSPDEGEFTEQDGVLHSDEEDEEGSGDDGPVMPMNKTQDDPFLSMLADESSSKVADKGVGQKDGGCEEDEGASEEDVEPMIETHTTYNESIDWKLQKPIVGMRFESNNKLKYMLCNYAVANGYRLSYKKNDKNRLLVVCCDGDCEFRLFASWMRDEKSFQIKSLIHKHNCARNFKMGAIVTYAWIGSHFTKDFLHKQKMSVRMLREEVKKQFGIDASMSQCRRAKSYALSLIDGTLVDHYARLWSYAEEIRRSNPGSTVKLGVNVLGNGLNYFSKFYVCFDGIKRGWLEGCRRIINLDGCFLKGICSGELLSAIGRDANNHIFPIAWAVVCVENKENWKWFLENLQDDLNLKCGGHVTLMSDQHKGLLEAVKEVLPDAEHRQCARHIFANFKRRFSGAHWEKMFWKASKASTLEHFNAAMKEIQALSQTAYQHLVDRNPKSWSRAFFRTNVGCDAVENGISESFNNLILDARKKPIITMLEEIRLYVMERMFKLAAKGSNWEDYKVCPNIRLLLNELGEHQRFWQVLQCGYQQFEARNMNEAYVVDLERKTCACRIWQLNGYGCVHSVAAIAYLNASVDAYVDPLLYATFYKNVYKFPLMGMNGSDMWPPTEYIPPLPPLKRRMPGRPTIKRKRDITESTGKHRVSRAGKRVLCSVCKQQGHNKVTCPSNQPPKKIPKKKIKKPKQSTKGQGKKEEGQGSGGGIHIGENIVHLGTQGSGTNLPKDGINVPPGTEGGGTPIPKGDYIVPPCTQSSVTNFNVDDMIVTPTSQAVPYSQVSQAKTRKSSERILKQKLAKKVKGINGEGESAATPLELDH